eukprot:11220780-Lingulodinium_polyedra.AAC.1
MVSQPLPTPATNSQSGVGVGQRNQAAGASTSPESDGSRSNRQSREDISQSHVIVRPEGP